MFVRFRLKLINPENFSGKTSISDIVPSHIRKFKYISINNYNFNFAPETISRRVAMHRLIIRKLELPYTFFRLNKPTPNPSTTSLPCSLAPT